MLEEYNCNNVVQQACPGIKELGVPFFHHDVMKKALVGIIEKRCREEWLWGCSAGAALVTS